MNSFDYIIAKLAFGEVDTGSLKRAIDALMDEGVSVGQAKRAQQAEKAVREKVLAPYLEN
jgi:hypothetical protein